MSPVPRILPAALALLLAACDQKTLEAPWLTYPGVDGHARYVPLLGTSHDPGAVTCADCHPGASFTQPVCTVCHEKVATTSLHTGSTGVLAGFQFTDPPDPLKNPPIAWQRPSCLATDCHPRAGIPDASHHSFFPVGDGTPHSRAAMGSAAGSFCKACHREPLDKGNLATLECVTCHQNPASVSAPLPGNHANLLTANSYPIVPTSRDCLRCHDGGQVDRVATHGSRPGPTGYGGAGPWDGSAAECAINSDGCKHGVAPTGTPTACNVQPLPRWCVSCFACHDALPPAFGGALPGLTSRPWAQDWKIPATTANQAAATACRGCHGPQ